MATLALSLAGTRLVAQPQQRGGPPGADTPRLVMATFHSDDRKLGTDAAEELRRRLISDFSMKELYVLTQKDINNTLEASGYRADSALNTSDLMELSKQLRGDETLEGTAAKTATGVHETVRLLLRRNNTILSQPLPPVDAKDAGDAAKQIQKEYEAARKSLPAYKTCENDLRAAKYADAEKDGRAALQAYPNSTFGRLCLLTAYNQEKASPDSIISVANQILAIDPTSIIALSNAADAYRTKGDKDKAIEYNLRIYRADPSNMTLAQSIVQELAQSGAPDKALPIIDSLLKDNPGDPQMLRTKWLLELNGKQFKQALVTGEEWVKADTSAANVDYYNRQIGAAQSDSNSAAVLQFATKAAQKFPKEPSFPLLMAQTYLKAGQLQQALDAARRAAQADPKSPTAWIFEVVVQNQMSQPDSALATAQQAIAAGVPKDSIGTSLMSLVGPAVQKAQQSKARADWEAALKAAQAVDNIAPSAQSKYFVGVTSFQVAYDAVQNVSKLYKSTKKDDHAQACSEAQVAEDQLATTSMAMPAGGAVDKNSAAQILGAIPQLSDFVSQVKKALKCK
ncbi:MAG TPA: tetratricopeptide repeat protein [Gemmatimonadaceae bacterium]|nr:tetratricopeptide repeat protein [Gemmatimonadaceae bacterium]